MRLSPAMNQPHITASVNASGLVCKHISVFRLYGLRTMKDPGTVRIVERRTGGLSWTSLSGEEDCYRRTRGRVHAVRMSAGCVQIGGGFAHVADAKRCPHPGRDVRVGAAGDRESGSEQVCNFLPPPLRH